MKIAFWDFSAIENPDNTIFISLAYYSSLIYAGFLICFSITQLVLSFVKKSP